MSPRDLCDHIIRLIDDTLRDIPGPHTAPPAPTRPLATSRPVSTSRPVAATHRSSTGRQRSQP